MEQRRTEFIETEQLERAASVIVEHAEIVGFPDIPLDKREMRTIAFLSKTDRNLVAMNFSIPLLASFLISAASTTESWLVKMTIGPDPVINM